MFKKSKTILIVFFLLGLIFNPLNTAYSIEEQSKYPDYAQEYVGFDRFEKFNRKMFHFNTKLNKYTIRPIHILWASVMPKYGMDRIKSIHENMIYPQKLVSSTIQRDFKAVKTETLRFLTNTTIGLGGMFDPAKRFFKLYPAPADMETALANCNIKQGPFLILPVISASSPRAVVGRILDWGLDPSSYIGTPVIAAVKAGILINRTSYMQPLMKMIESNYADPYDITKKLYGLERHIKAKHLDRNEILATNAEIYKINSDEVYEETDIIEEEYDENTAQLVYISNLISDSLNISVKSDLAVKLPKNGKIKADIVLNDYNPQNPVTDAMRTALFNLPEVTKSLWSDLSVWNRCFNKRIKTDSVNIVDGREDYKFRYILQKDKTSPLAIIFPSIGEGVSSYHSAVLAKIFYDEGYSVLIQGNHFQWEFVKSMPEDYKPGLPFEDAKYLKLTTSKIVDLLEQKHERKFGKKVILGTSLGAMATLFIADSEYKENTLNVVKYIAINPPIELNYAIKQFDKNNEFWKEDSESLKENIAYTVAKVIKMLEIKENERHNINSLPFSEKEAKLITGFILHQKLSDLIFSLENISPTKKCEAYKVINNMNYNDYVNKYFLSNNPNFDINYQTSLFSISDYLRNNDNYIIYHAIDDYLVNPEQLSKLKQLAGSNAIYMSNGSHLGFLYKEEFINSLREKIPSTKLLVGLNFTN